MFPPRRRTAFPAFDGQTKGGEGNLLIPQWLMADLPRKAGEDLLNLKELLPVFPPRGAAAFSRAVARLKRGVAYLLIQQGLLSRLGRSTAAGVVQSKGLAKRVSVAP